MDNKEFGWELLYHSVEPFVNRKEDVLITFVHFVLIKNEFRCYGYDGEASIENQDGTELLPPNWNTRESLTLKYKLKEQNFVLQVTKSQGKIIVNLLNPDKVEASSVVFEIESSVSEIKGPLRVILPKHTEIRAKVENCLLKAVLPECSGKRKTDTTSTNEKKPPDWTPPNPRPSAERDRDREEYFDPFGVGRSDLDPLGRIGGGMLFQPPRRGGIVPGLGVPGGLPRAGIPPGARFDPFGPPDLDRPGRGSGRGRFSNPDHDHLPPPGYDDMFM